MSVITFLLALSPIAVVLIGIMAFKQPAMKVAPLALIWALFLAFTYFNVTGASFAENVDTVDALIWQGIKEGAKIVWMVFGAFVILNILKTTGAIDDVKATIASISNDRRVQAVVVGIQLPIFLEGAAGAGAPAAIAAPFLVALGFNPILAMAMALLGDSTPCSWGGAGLTTITGGAALTTAGLSTTALNSAMVGRIHMVGVFIIPFLVTVMAFGRPGLKGAWGYLTWASVTTSATMFALSNFVGPEVTSMGTGLIGILLSVLYVKVVGLNTPDEFRYDFDSAQPRKYSSLRALSPYLYILVLLPAVRYGFPALVDNGFAVMTTFGYIVWVDVVIMVCGMAGAATLGLSLSEYGAVCASTLKSVVPVLVTMGSLLVVSYIMQSPSTGMMTVLANSMASVAGVLYPAAAVLIGSGGSFITGTGLASNIMFADLHIQASSMLNMNPITVFAGQNAGASLGNMICPNNTVAACATVGEVGNENAVMRHTLPAFGVLLATYMGLAVLYTHVLFPTFGM